MHQDLLAQGPTHEIHPHGELQAVHRKALFMLFLCRFSVDESGPDGLTARGSFTDHQYELERGGRTAATAPSPAATRGAR
jgi:uncharacterized protein YxjI